MENTKKLPEVYSFYRSNIHPDILSYQRKVFEHLDIELIQCLDDTISHSDWLNKIFNENRNLTVVCDIDAFPLSRESYISFVEKIDSGSVVGLEQVANHLDPDITYAGPMFLGCLGSTYEHLGRPNLANCEQMDVGQNLTKTAVEYGVKIDLIPPKFAINPKWALRDRGVFGIGTFYGNLDFFHLFEARHQSSIDLFKAVSDGVTTGKHDFAKYIEKCTPKRREKNRNFFKITKNWILP